MPVVATNAAPSPLADVLRQVVDVFTAVGDATPIEIGKEYLPRFGAGTPPRVLFVPHVRGEAMPPIEIGYAASLNAGCNVLVRGAEDGSDVGRYDSAAALLARVMDFLGTACTGRIEWGSFEDDSPVAVDCYGADLAVGFKYRYDLRHDAARRRLAPATSDASAASSAVSPHASPGTVDSIEIESQEPS